ncbi:hypothetical protein K492DRAFT_224561 [Lichtheimia hyalospora FSU 10163]|nr:hypothetical protein K492DRAFT_224561 [Lichtheimia hyalospora FSU 10163]
MQFKNIPLAIAAICFVSTINAAPTGASDAAKAGQGTGDLQQGNNDATTSPGTTTGAQSQPLGAGDLSNTLGGLDPTKLADVGVDNKKLTDQIANVQAILDNLENLKDLAEDSKEDGVPPTTGGVPDTGAAVAKQPNTGKPPATEQQEEGDNNTA